MINRNVYGNSWSVSQESTNIVLANNVLVKNHIIAFQGLFSQMLVLCHF